MATFRRNILSTCSGLNWRYLVTLYWPGNFSFSFLIGPLLKYFLYLTLRKSTHFPASPLQPWRWKQYVSQKRRRLPTSLHGAKAQNNNAIMCTVFTLGIGYLLLAWLLYYKKIKNALHEETQFTNFYGFVIPNSVDHDCHLLLLINKGHLYLRLSVLYILNAK